MANEAASDQRVTELALAFADELNIRGQPINGTAGQILVKTSSTNFASEWQDAPSGGGDVVGPASAVNGAPALFSGTSGKLIGVGSTTGTGAIVAAISPTLTTPVLGAATVTTVNKLTITAPASSATLTIADGKTLTASNTLTFTGTDGSSLNIGTGGTLGTNAYTSTAYLPTAGGTMTGALITVLSATGGAGFRLPPGAAPTSPVNGDLWTTSSGIFVRINSSTVGPLAAGGGGGGDVFGPSSATDGVPALFDTTTGKLLKNSTPTGTGNPVMQTSPTLTTPVLGVATATSINKLTLTQPATGATLTIPDGLTLNAGPGGTLTALAFTTPGTGVATALGINVGSAGAFVTLNGAGGTPSSITLTNATGMPIAGVTGLGTGVATFLATPSSANLAAALTDETGSGSNVFATSPTLVTPILGTPTSGNLSNCTVDGTNAVGFRGIPINSQSTAYTTVLTDAGGAIYHPTTDNNARTYTIAANASVAYPINTAITFINDVNTITIAINSDTLVLSPGGSTGSRTLAAFGMATAIKVTSTRWLISGSGLT